MILIKIESLKVRQWWDMDWFKFCNLGFLRILKKSILDIDILKQLRSSIEYLGVI